MARRTPRPLRRLMLFGLAIVLLYGGVALGGQWQPTLGLDLQGGTRITLSASTANGQKVTAANLEEARKIIDQRVNGNGVTEGNVATQGGNNIVVEIPGKKRGDLVDSVKQTAQLRFRLVAASAAGTKQPAASPSASPSASGRASGRASGSASGAASPSGGASPSARASGSAGASSSPTASATSTPKGRALSGGLEAADSPSASPAAASGSAPTTASPSAAASPTASSLDPSAAASALASAAAGASSAATPATTAKGAPVDQPLTWMDNPGDAWLKKFTAYTCPTGNAPLKVNDVPSKPLVTCDADGFKYLLSASVIEGTQLKSAGVAAPDQQSVKWRVTLAFDGSGRKKFTEVTTAIANATSPLTGQEKQFAIVLDGEVLSAPTTVPINTGTAEITGTFTQTSAQSLANSLKYGALPLKFTAPAVTEQGPTLASDQLSAGLTAGGIGLLMVMAYCLLYYRGLGSVVVASLFIAAGITYAVVLAMSQAIDFTLTLPGIAGLIVAVGITADSFIVYFERIRDEMRTGKSMRVAVEAGWVRARATCLAADAVSLLAAVVLYIFSIGVVKGFAFALGVSTVIDLVVFFLFTKPMVSWLAGFRFFYTGHKWSGLSADQVGSRRRATSRPSTAGGAS